MTDDQGWLARRRRHLMDGYADRSRAKVAGRPQGSRAPSATTLAVWALAGLVHVVSFAVLAAGVWLVWVGPLLVRIPGVVVVVFGLLLLPRPHLGRGPTGLTRSDLPEVFTVLDRVAALSRAPVPHLVRVTGDFNAGAASRRRRRVLVIGAPLWVAHPAPARLALLGHELGHFAHRDLLSSAWTGSAREAIFQWLRFFGEAGQERDGWYGQVEYDTDRPANAVIRVVALPFRFVLECGLYLFEALAASSSRRQEYLADLDAISAAGSAGAVASHDATLAHEAVEAAVRRAAIRGDDDVWSEVRGTLAQDDATVLVRRRANAQREQSRIDETHPSTAQRIRLVEEREQVGPGVVVDTATWQRVDAELAPYLDEAGAELARAVRYQW